MDEQETSQSLPVEAPLKTGVIDILARMPERAILDEKAMAEVFGVTTRTVRRMVGRHEIPPGVPLAGKTAWMAGKVLAFLEQKLEQAEKSAMRRNEAFLKNRP
jgi:predicted DNA-binding transcriptional regulator AlpA